jgi:4-carboxymuconolactone decarboxylase
MEAEKRNAKTMCESNRMNELTPSSTSTAIPLAPLPGHVAARVRRAGVKQVNLYRALAHAPRLLEAWIDFSWSLREQCETPRALRELIILRTAQLTHAPYEWHQHRRMAAEAGVDEHRVAELAMWRTSPAFTEAERAALAFTDALADGDVPDEVNAALDEHFDEQARVELTLTASFYFGVPRLLNALRVPVEVNPAPPESASGKD